MTRLPTALEPLFPYVKTAHRGAARTVGAVSRRTTARRPGPHAPPRRGTATATETAAREPGAVVRHHLSDAETLRRPVPEGTPAGHPFWRALGSVELPGRFVLEIAGGRAVGAYAAHLTPGGLLDFETSDYFGARGWREHPVNLRWRLPAPTHLAGTAVSLATRGTAANYYHFLLDLLPRWGILREAFPMLAPDHVVLNRGTSYQRELLELLAARDPGLAAAAVVEQTPDLVVSADRLLVPSLPNHETLAPPWTTDWLRTTFLGGGPRPGPGGPRRLYLTRGDRRHTRRLVNEAAVLPMLREHGFEVVDCGRLSVREQIELFSGVEAVVAPHGAALTNLVFAPPGVRVLELFAPRYVNCCFWAITANRPDSRYRYLVGTGGRRVDPAGRMLGVQDDITVDVREFEVALEQVLGACSGSGPAPAAVR